MRSTNPKLGGMGMAAYLRQRNTPKRLDNPLVAAVSHPTRTMCFAILAERAASPAEIGRELDLDVTIINYHVSVLASVNLVEEVANRAVRGSIEHFYKAVELPEVTGDQEAGIDMKTRRTFAETVIAMFAANAARSLDEGRFLARGDHHLTRTAMIIDRQGWNDMLAAYMELYERVNEIQSEAAERLPESGDDEVPVRVVSFQALFEIPRPGK